MPERTGSDACCWSIRAKNRRDIRVPIGYNEHIMRAQTKE